MGSKPAYRWLAAAAGVAVLVLLVVLAVVRPGSGGDGDAGPPTPAPVPPPVAVLSAASGDAPIPTVDGVRAAIDELVRGGLLGERVSVSVVDAATGEYLYQRDAETTVVPASTIKLVTAATVLASRGPAYRLDTVVVAGDAPGEVVLIGGGDPTLAAGADGFYPDAARLDVLADQVAAALGDTPVRRVIVDTSLFTGPVHGPWDDGIAGSGFVGPVTALMIDGARTDPDPAQGQQAAARSAEPELAAGAAFAARFGLTADAVALGKAPALAAAPAPAEGSPPSSPPPVPVDQPGAELGRVSSPPLLRLTEIMLDSSDNVVAEVLARQVALARGEPASYDGAATAMAAVLAELGVDQSGVRLADGSGLSRDNKLTAAALTDLLAVAATGPAQSRLGGMFAGLPVAGWSGTLADRYRPTDTNAPVPALGAGVVRAKTGTLNGVSTLAGLVVTADGRLLVFALLADQVQVGPEASRPALDKIAAALAGCGCRD